MIQWLSVHLLLPRRMLCSVRQSVKLRMVQVGMYMGMRFAFARLEVPEGRYNVAHPDPVGVRDRASSIQAP